MIQRLVQNVQLDLRLKATLAAVMQFQTLVQMLDLGITVLVEDAFKFLKLATHLTNKLGNA